MDKAILSEFKLQLNFIAGMTDYAAVVRYFTYLKLFLVHVITINYYRIFKVKFKTSTYRSILPGDVSAIFGFGPNYYVTPTIENYINYFPLNDKPHVNVPVGTIGYFSVAAGSFIQDQTTEER
jgi:hypothetical protein